MKKIIHLVVVLAILPFLSHGQTPKRIHDLKSLTDSSGTVHLFYRIYSEYEGTEYITDNIYHYNTQTGEESLFFENFYDDRLGFPFSQNITDYKFLNKDPKNYVYTIRYCDNECSEFVGRNDSTEGMGGLFVTMDNLNVEGNDSGRVYVEAYGEVVIGRNGGRDWPNPNEENDFEIPDSSTLGFPLMSLSPSDDSLMFGRKSFNPDGENTFLRSTDRGSTSEFLSDTLLPNYIEYDIDSSTVYIIDRVNAPGFTCTFETCKYGVYINSNRGAENYWQKLKIFDDEINLYASRFQSGKLYAWSIDSILVTENYGETFEVLINSEEDITGFSSSSSKEYYTTTSSLYSYENENSVKVLSIPVANELTQDIPTRNKLLQNYPNPFNPTTTISYEMKRPGKALIELYTVTGQLVRKLVHGYKNSGRYSFQLDGGNLPSGVYILRGRLGEEIQSRTITLIK